MADDGLRGARVVMLETVTRAHTWQGGEHLNAGWLLRFMDIATCASAELFTGVNCVTVSVGDFSIDQPPQLGDTLELVAEPVLAGTTSLEIRVVVTAERPALANARSQRRTVCIAQFTYVTVRDAHGGKVLCPPLTPETDAARWEMLLADARKKLLRLEAAAPRSAPSPAPTAQSAARPWAWPCLPRAREALAEQTTVEMTEVVLPPHQNHMQHTFGGIIMDWAHKAAAICATRHAGEPQSLRTLMVNRISFREGSAVSDHLVFCASVNQVFDGGAVMEVGVRVSKRDIRDGARQKCAGAFFYFARESARRIPPLAPPADAVGLSRRLRAERRYALLTARRQLLARTRGTLRWDRAFGAEAAMLSVESVVRLAQAQEGAGRGWRPLYASGRVRAAVAFYGGSASGVAETLRLRCHARLAAGRASASEALSALVHRRAEWDPNCTECTSIEPGDVAAEAFAGAWDVVRMTRRLPLELVVARCAGRTQLVVSALRAWRLDPQGGRAIMAVRSVKHVAVPEASAEVLPSGFFLAPSDEDGALEIVYVIEVELAPARRAALFASDAHIAGAMARSFSATLAGLVEHLERPSAGESARCGIVMN